MRYNFVLKATFFYASPTSTCIMLILSALSSVFFFALNRSHRGNKLLGRMNQHPACRPLWIFIEHLSFINQVFFSEHCFVQYVTSIILKKENSVCACGGYVHVYVSTHAHICATCPLALLLGVFILLLRPCSVFHLSF